jgi:hypothetical protein
VVIQSFAHQSTSLVGGRAEAANHIALFLQSFLTKGHANIGHIRLMNRVAYHTGEVKVVTKPMTLERHLETALQTRVSCELAHIYVALAGKSTDEEHLFGTGAPEPHLPAGDSL